MMARKVQPIIHTCKYCNEPFQIKRKEQLFCSYSCSNKYRWSDPSYKKRLGETLSKVKTALFAEGKLVPSNKGRIFSQEWRRNISRNHYLGNGGVHWLKGKPLSEETKRKISAAGKGKVIPEDVRKRISQTMKKVARDQNFIRHILDNCIIRPNKLEQGFITLCEQYNLPFKYTGDGSFWVGNMNPDFVHITGKKITVEIFGDYWHSIDSQPNLKLFRTEVGRIEAYKSLGWDCIIIWEHELATDPLSCISRVRKEVMP